MFPENPTGLYAAVQANFFFEAISTKLTSYNDTLRTAKDGEWAMRPVKDTCLQKSHKNQICNCMRRRAIHMCCTTSE